MAEQQIKLNKILENSKKKLSVININENNEIDEFIEIKKLIVDSILLLTHKENMIISEESQISE